MHTINVNRFQHKVLRFFVIEHIALNKVDSQSFREMMIAASPALANISLSRASLRNWAVTAFGREKQKIKALLQSSQSKIHLSFDIWTSPNRYAILGVVAHFVVKDDSGLRSVSKLLGLKWMREAHGAEEITKELLEVIYLEG